MPKNLTSAELPFGFCARPNTPLTSLYSVHTDDSALFAVESLMVPVPVPVPMLVPVPVLVLLTCIQLLLLLSGTLPEMVA